MDKIVTTALLIVISMVLAMVLFNAAYPAIISGGDAITNMSHRQADQMKSQIAIIQEAGELDSNATWQDTNGNNQFDVFIWVKNIGSTSFNPIDSTDVFFGPEGNYFRIPFQGNANGSYPNWTWNVENGSTWGPTATLKIAIHYLTPLSVGRYYSKVTTINGASDQYLLGM
jgi:archaellum component FlaG (FlaF/FlaG flagellin family)